MHTASCRLVTTGPELYLPVVVLTTETRSWSCYAHTAYRLNNFSMPALDTYLLTYLFTYLLTYLLTYSMEQSPS
jgi:hypothetical protein